ncbi:hypothetical protein [Algoriphagus confluentis]|uniref:hypothetical protein n=1 Tax=Algoriphagus confluentis TaxID=1697556 RepID=UPI0030C6F3FD
MTTSILSSASLKFNSVLGGISNSTLVSLPSHTVIGSNWPLILSRKLLQYLPTSDAFQEQGKIASLPHPIPFRDPAGQALLERAIMQWRIQD